MPCCWDCVRRLVHGARDTRNTESHVVARDPVLAGSRRPERSEEDIPYVPKSVSRQPVPQLPPTIVERHEESSEVETVTIDEDDEENSYYSDEQEEAAESIHSPAQFVLRSDFVFPETPVRGIRVNSLQPVYHPDFADWRDCVSPMESRPLTPLMATLEGATESVAVFFRSSFRQAPP